MPKTPKGKVFFFFGKKKGFWNTEECPRQFRFLPSPSSSSSGLIPARCSVLASGSWVRQCVWNLQTQSRICLCKSMWRWKEEARCLVTYPHPPRPSTKYEATLAPCPRPWWCTESLGHLTLLVYVAHIQALGAAFTPAVSCCRFVSNFSPEQQKEEQLLSFFTSDGCELIK